jgi:hypothetical protein
MGGQPSHVLRRDAMDNPAADHLTGPQLVSALTRNWARIGFWLVAAPMGYNVAEGAIALWAGAHAGSIALVGFGLDSYIECAAAVSLLVASDLRSVGSAFGSGGEG